MATLAFSIFIAPRAANQMQEAVQWWRLNRSASPDLLTNEILTALDLVEAVPEVGRRVASRHFRNVRRLLLRRTSYQLYYQIDRPRREVHVVAFRHSRRRPGEKL